MSHQTESEYAAGEIDQIAAELERLAGYLARIGGVDDERVIPPSEELPPGVLDALQQAAKLLRAAESACVQCT